MSDKRSIIICAEVSPDQKHLIAISSDGDLLLFSLPSLKLLQSDVSYHSDEKVVPIQVQWISEDSLVVLHSNGQIIRGKLYDYFNGNACSFQLTATSLKVLTRIMRLTNLRTVKGFERPKMRQFMH